MQSPQQSLNEARRPLGIYAVSLHQGGRGKAKKPDRAGGPGWGLDGKAYRYELLRVAQRVLNRKDAQPQDQPRTVWCSRSFMSGAERVSVYKSERGARLAGLHTCGSVWTCPVCAAKIAEKRRLELQLAVRTWIERGGFVYLLTLTFPHQAEDDLADLVTRQAEALQRFKNSKRFKRILGSPGKPGLYQRAGSVRGLECTFGINGPHPHTHDLVFARPGLDQDRASINELRRAWMRACLKVGLIRPNGTLKPFRDFWRHAFDLSGGTRAAEYIAKYGRDERWGVTSEMTRNYAKVGMAKAMWSDDLHVTPFQLLEWSRNGDKFAAALFRNFAEVFEGKRALSWSPGLKSELGIRDATDEELAGDGEPAPEELRIGQLDVEQFRIVLSRNAVGELIRYAGAFAENQTDLDDFVRTIERLPEVGRGTMLARSRINESRVAVLYA